jgi:hemin uptake protein HemP
MTRRDSPATMNKAQAKLAGRDSATQSLDTGSLFADGSEVVITHGTEIYRLRLTRQNRLILTK